MKINMLIQSIKSNGFLKTFNKIIYGYLEVIKFIVFYLNLEDDFVFLDRSGVTVRKLSIEDLNEARVGNSNFSPEFYCDITHMFSSPFVSYLNDKVAAIIWVVYPGESSRFLGLVNGDVEINYSYVLPEFRGENLISHLMSYVIIYCKKNGLKRMFGVVSATNIPQFKQMLKIGFVPVEALTHFFLKRPKATLRYVR